MFCLPAAHACTRPIYILVNFAEELEDGEHVLAMNYDQDPAFEYPVSGVYRKGPDKQLIWEIPIELVVPGIRDHLSASGRYFVKTFFERAEGPGFPEAVVSIYDNGYLMHEFYWDTFTSDRSVPQPDNRPALLSCLPNDWGKMEYDKQLDVIRIESFRDRVVTIHVPTAQILYVEYLSGNN